jgi:hypothetical protein
VINHALTASNWLAAKASRIAGFFLGISVQASVVPDAERSFATLLVAVSLGFDRVGAVAHPRSPDNVIQRLRERDGDQAMS